MENLVNAYYGVSPVNADDFIIARSNDLMEENEVLIIPPALAVSCLPKPIPIAIQSQPSSTIDLTDDDEDKACGTRWSSSSQSSV